MKKRGFTLIEIIVCIALLGLIVIGGTILTIKNKNNNLEKVTKSILESAQVYLEMEMDEKGNTYKDGLLLGGTAVSIPLKELVNTGYIKDDTIKTLEKNGVSNAKNNYVLAAVFSGTVAECDNDQSVIEFKASWDDELKNLTEPLYICEYTNKDDENNVFVLKEKLNLKANLNKFAVSKEYYDTVPEEEKDNYTYEENGVFIYYNVELDVIYYYFRGTVYNNYLKLGKDSSGKDLYWRILWLSDDNRMKLVLDDEVPLYLKNGEDKRLITLEKNNIMYSFITNTSSYHFLNPIMTSTSEYYTYSSGYIN